MNVNPAQTIHKEPKSLTIFSQDFLFVFLRQNATYKENLLFINTYMESLDISKKSLDASLLFIMSRDILDQLLCLFNDFSDEIPKEIIHSDSVNTKYKIRGGRFYAVSLKISRLHTYGLISDDILQECDLCIQNYHKHHKENGGLTTKEDIDMMNNILRKTIEHLQIHK